MAFVNLKTKVIQVKIVYYGPGRGGKTTNLEYIYRKFQQRINSEMVTVKTHGDRTLFFDFLPFDIGMINGYNIKIQLYTVPGQVKYNATRRLVLRGVDGVVFVADAMAVCREKNIQSLENLQENLASYKKPRWVEFRNELPKNPTGKILKRLIRDEYWKGRERKI
jgi:signal recognition particle receptor subunit beta